MAVVFGLSGVLGFHGFLFTEIGEEIIYEGFGVI